MDWPTILSFSSFAFVAAFTPGPNNIMLAASGANFGFRATLPHIIGICIGFCLLVLMAGFGLANLFALIPELYTILKFVSFLFLLYLAWKIATAAAPEQGGRTTPLRLWQAALFQMVNPKGISVIISAVTAYTSTVAALANDVVIMLIVFSAVTIAATCTWTVFGVFIRDFLRRPGRLRWFNSLMALLLLASLIPIVAV